MATSSVKLCAAMCQVRGQTGDAAWAADVLHGDDLSGERGSAAAAAAARKITQDGVFHNTVRLTITQPVGSRATYYEDFRAQNTHMHFLFSLKTHGAKTLASPPLPPPPLPRYLPNIVM